MTDPLSDERRRAGIPQLNFVGRSPHFGLIELPPSGVARTIQLGYKVRAGHVREGGACAGPMPGPGMAAATAIMEGACNLAARLRFRT
jgi:hypothetical protein